MAGLPDRTRHPAGENPTRYPVAARHESVPGQPADMIGRECHGHVSRLRGVRCPVCVGVCVLWVSGVCAGRVVFRNVFVTCLCWVCHVGVVHCVCQGESRRVRERENMKSYQVGFVVWVDVAAADEDSARDLADNWLRDHESVESLVSWLDFLAIEEGEDVEDVED